MATEEALGRTATRPRELRRGWKDVALRVKDEAKRDNLTLIAAGVAFYAFFALFPTLFAIVAIYGLVADPAHVGSQVDAMGTVLPSGAREIIDEQLTRVASTSSSTLGWGLLLSVVLAFWSASKGVRGLIDAINIAYDERESRGFFKRTGLTLLLTIGGIFAVILAVGALVAVPAILGSIGLGTVGHVLAQIARWVVLVAVIIVGLAVLYRLAPSRDAAKWRWITPGSILASVIWLLVSVGFALYVQWFGSYQQTFGSLAAVAILLMWFYFSALAILLGAETNAEAERQTRRDTTAGHPEPMGRRGAYAADTVGPSREEPGGTPQPAT